MKLDNNFKMSKAAKVLLCTCTDTTQRNVLKQALIGSQNASKLQRHKAASNK